MTRKDRKRYSREFKLEAVKRVNESGKPVTEVARELGISGHLLYRWRDEVQQDPREAFPGKGHQGRAQEELEQLKRENARLREERDILKKAAAYFAKESE
jgi:transposase